MPDRGMMQMSSPDLQTQFANLTDDDFVEYAQAVYSSDKPSAAETKRVLAYLSQPDIMMFDPVHVSGRTATRSVTFECGRTIDVTIGES